MRCHTRAQHHLARAEPWLRLAVPLMLAVFLASLAAGSWLQGRADRAVALSDAVDDIECVARLATAALASSTVRSTPLDLTAARDRLASLLPAGALPRGRRLLLVDAQDRIAASLPPTLEPATLTALLGDEQPLSVLGSRAGAMTLTLPSGERVLATVQGIEGDSGRVAVVQSVAEATARTAAGSGAQATLLAAAGLVVVCMGFAYTMQAGRARAVDELCERVKRRVDTAFGRGRCGLWDWNIARGTVYWSDSMYEILGYAPATDLLSFGEVNALVHPDDEDLHGLARELAAARQSAVDHEIRLRHASGEWVWLKARAETVNDPEDGTRHLVGIFVDITEQRRLAEAGAAADARLRGRGRGDLRGLRALGRAEPPRPVQLEVPGPAQPAPGLRGPRPPLHRGDGRGRAAHDPARGARRRGGPDRGAGAGGRARRRPLAPDQRAAHQGRRLRLGGHRRHRAQAPAGAPRRLERALMATVKDLKRSRQALEIQAQQLADIAERYLDQKAQAESANTSKSEFLANMSHELRTPLNAVMGFAELMENEVYGALGHPRYAGYCRDIRASGEYLLTVIDDILDMSRIEARRVNLAPRTIPVAEALERAVRLVEEAARLKGMAVERAVRPGATVGADERALQQILVNLLQNAVKFTPEDGRVACRVRAVGAWTHLYVEDSGIGIPRRILPKIGQPFEQVETEYSRRYKGSGLGLAIARSLTELHGGALRIRSQEGQGTIVLVRLPRAAPPLPIPPHPRRSQPRRPPRFTHRPARAD